MTTLLITSSRERAEEMAEKGLEFDVASYIRFDTLLENMSFGTIIFDEATASDTLKMEISPLVAKCNNFVRVFEKDGFWTTIVTKEGTIPNVQ